MRHELEERLVKAFPQLYGDCWGNPQETCMAFGFEVSDGWFDLIWRVSEKLEAQINLIPEAEREHYRASQVKEKFGTLRFYMSAYNEEMDKAINEAEEESARTCEACGSPGTLRRGGWWLTLCDIDAKERGRE